MALLYLKVRAFFAMWPVHFYEEKFVFSITAWYLIHMLKLQCHYASLKLNVWIILASLYSKLTAIFAELYEISRFLRIFDNPII